MKTHEIINNHEGLIFFYPFSGTHFEIIKPLNDAISGLNKKILYVYCSIGGTQEEFDNWRINNPLARGLYEEVHFTENKLGLKRIKIETFERLTDVEFDARHYSFENCELVYVKVEAFNFIEYLEHNMIDIVKMNLIFSFAGGFDDVLKALILKFHPIKAIEDNENSPKMIVVNNHYVDELKELFKHSTFYQYSLEIKENEDDNQHEIYTIFFEDKGYYLAANILRRFL